jgi:ketosteroid isomerase-like protein
MSDQENVRTVKAMFEAFGKGDLPGALAFLAEDVEWRLAGPTEVTYAGTRRGRDQVAELFKLLEQTSDFEQFEAQEFIAQGDRVVVLGHERQRVKATGLVAENDFAMVFTVRDGKITHFRNYEDTAAVAAAHRKT